MAKNAAPDIHGGCRVLEIWML